MRARRPGPAAPARTRGWTLELEVEHGHAAAAAVLFDGADPMGPAESMVQGKEEEEEEKEETREEETREYESGVWPHHKRQRNIRTVRGVVATAKHI